MASRSVLTATLGIAGMLAACGSDETASTAASTVAAPTTTEVGTTTGAPAGSTTSATTSTITSTITSTTASAASGSTVVLAAADEPVELHTGEVVRFETGAAAFELAGQDGWDAYVTPVSLWFTPHQATGTAWVSIVRLKDAHPELGATGADLTGAGSRSWDHSRAWPSPTTHRCRWEQ